MSLFPRRKSAAASFRKPRRRTTTVPAEVLEDRTLLTGLVMEESVFSVSQFADNIEEQVLVDELGPNGVVGYSYAIIDGDPDNPISGADGVRRLAWDTPSGIGAYPADPKEPQENASLAKSYTGASIMHLLQQKVLDANPTLNPNTNPELYRTLLEVELDTPIVNYLPQDWGPGNPASTVNDWTANFEDITIRMLMTHTSGLRSNNAPGGWVTTSTLPNGPGVFSGNGSIYNYAGLQEISEFGAIDPAPPAAGEYWTNNFSWFRVMLPYMWDEVPNQWLNVNTSNSLFPLNAVPDDLAADIVADWELTPGPANIVEIDPDELTSSIYAHYVRKYLFDPSGVVESHTQTEGLTYTLHYPLDPTIVPGSELWPNGAGQPPTPATVFGFDTGVRTLELGPRGWRKSAEGAAQAFHGIRYSGILHDETLKLMDEEGLGWRNISTSPTGFSGDFGQYYGHDGVNFRPRGQDAVQSDGSTGTAISRNYPTLPTDGAGNVTARLSPMNETIGIAFPNEVSAAILFNSQIRTADQPGNSPSVIGAAFNPGGVGTGTATTLINAYDNAWTELVYDGDQLFDGNSDDEFVLKLNANPDYIDFFHDDLGNPVFTRRIDTLEKLTINGFHGTNEYFIEALPESLELVINGGFGVDNVIVGRRDLGPISVDNLGEFAPGLLRFDGSGGNDRLELTDGLNAEIGKVYEIHDDEVTRSGDGPGPREYEYEDVEELVLTTSFQSDTILVQSTNADTTTTINSLGSADELHMFASIAGSVDIFGGTASDTLMIFDVFNSTPRDYLFEANLLTIDDEAEVGFDVEIVELYAGSGGDTIDVNGLAAGQSLLLDGNFGNDEITIRPGRGFSTDVLGDIEVIGDFGSDTLNFNDFAYFPETDYHVTGTTVARTGVPAVQYGQVETLNVQGGFNGNEFFIAGTSAATTVTGWNQPDSFRVGSLNLDGINASLTIEGGDNTNGEDTVLFQDLLGTNLFYGIDDNRLFGFGFAGIELDEIELATLNASSFDNQVFVENAPANTRFVINGFAGDDTVTLAAVSQNLAGFNTPLVINGGSGDNHLILHDDDSAGAFAFNVTANSIDRTLFGEPGLFNGNIGVTFSAMTDVTLHMNSQSTNVNIESTTPSVELIFYGNYGSDTLNLNRHLDDATDTNIHIDGPHIAGENIDIQYYHFAQLNVNLGDENTRVVIEDLDSDADLNLGAGNDRLIITPESRNLTNINRTITVDGEAGRDRLILHDQDNPWWANYTITPTTIDRWFFGPFPGSEPGATYDNMEIVRLFMTAHDDIVNLNGTNPDTWYDLRGRRGGDTFNINQPPSSRVTLRGGNGTDTANIFGTRGDDEVSISSGNGTADVNLISIEEANFNGLTGTDVLVYQGVEGVNEEVNVHASNIANKALLIVAEDVEGETLDLVFENTEILDLIANPGDDDTATFHGTADRDLFRINLAAEGTNADPVLQLSNPAAQQPLLTLRDSRNFERLAVHGGDEADRFDVLVAPTGPGNGRNLFVDGGSPTGKGNPRDELHIFYARPPRPKIDREYNPQTDDGYALLAYEDYEFLIEFESIEKAKLKSLV